MCIRRSLFELCGWEHRKDYHILTQIAPIRVPVELGVDENEFPIISIQEYQVAVASPKILKEGDKVEDEFHTWTFMSYEEARKALRYTEEKNVLFIAKRYKFFLAILHFYF